MPTYEYQCNKCQRVFEVRQRISEPALTTCDACGGEVRRLLSPAPFILKGGGWYVTDYPSEARKQGMSAEKSSTSSDSKPAPEKSDTTAKADKPAAAAPKSDGAGTSSSTSGASSAAAKPAD